MYLSDNFRMEENFKINEFLTNKDDEYPTYSQVSRVSVLATYMQKLRDALRKEIRVTSGIRSVKYNKNIGGSKNSYHIYGLACDFELIKRVNGNAVEDYGDWTIETLLPIFELCGFSNVGFYIRNGKFQWIHADIGIPWADGTVGTWRSYSKTLSYQIKEV